jgi:hypothetical protein
MGKILHTPCLRDLPLWRLLVALADAERAFGPADQTTRDLAAVVQERLRDEPAPGAPQRERRRRARQGVSRE